MSDKTPNQLCPNCGDLAPYLCSDSPACIFDNEMLPEDMRRILSAAKGEYEDQITQLRSEVEELETKNAWLLGLLRRYRIETPTGHQPHMIAHEVDKVLDGDS